jgi:dTMP kinase
MHIVISGVDGSGKGTQCQLLKYALEEKGYSIQITKAYGDTEKEAFAPFVQYWDDLAITLLFQALHRQQYVDTQVALQKGRIVISDKWDDPYEAYHRQFGLLAKDSYLRNALSLLAFEGSEPDLGFVLDVPFEITEPRMRIRGKDFFDKKDVSFHQAMRNGYLAIASERNWVVLDGSKSSTTIHEEILNHILTSLIKQKTDLLT